MPCWCCCCCCCCFCRHTSRFLLCYIHCLPLLLWPLAEWGSPVLAVMISFLVLGIEGISSYIEEPFHVSLL
jgi:predicted membrane chloride channel (bestrophin family)